MLYEENYTYKKIDKLDYDELINSGKDYKKEIYNVLVEKESNAGVLYKKTKVNMT